MYSRREGGQSVCKIFLLQSFHCLSKTIVTPCTSSTLTCSPVYIVRITGFNALAPLPLAAPMASKILSTGTSTASRMGDSGVCVTLEDSTTT
mmetsp:Transcript_3584/g.8091  ORF Transcript_3584/g.8091 Transcript_3584/m.8091 type:complete len:92 (+) Transcript_3584:35-310(+)